MLERVIAVGTELLQYHISRRCPEVLDSLSDISGSVLGLLTGFLIKKAVKR
jgi:VanZ family protein